MKLCRDSMLLYAVTDRTWVGSGTLAGQVEAALKGGVTLVQLREKALDEKAFLDEAMEIGKLCRRYGVPFIVNDNVDIAVRAGADGVHLGQEDLDAGMLRRRVGSDLIIGVSAHTVDEALAAQDAGADYLGVGAVFSTETKRDVSAMSFGTLQAICAAVDIPVVAIGGIVKRNILHLSGSGVDGVAVVSAIFAQADPQQAAEELLELSKKMVTGHG